MWRAGRGLGSGAAACALLLLAAGAASAGSDKRHDMSPVPFVMGSRYGRSSPRLISPRNDKFFMGSRYGKRSEPVSGGAGGAGGAGGVTGARDAGARGTAARPAPAPAPAPALLCRYTGVFSLYRCLKHHTRTRARLNRRSFGDAGNGEEE